MINFGGDSRRAANAPAVNKPRYRRCVTRRGLGDAAYTHPKAKLCRRELLVRGAVLGLGAVVLGTAGFATRPDNLMRIIARLEGLGLWLPLTGRHGASDLSGSGRDGTTQGRLMIGTGRGMIGGSVETSTNFHGSSDRVQTQYAPFATGEPRTLIGIAHRFSTTTDDVLVGGV